MGVCQHEYASLTLEINLWHKFPIPARVAHSGEKRGDMLSYITGVLKFAMNFTGQTPRFQLHSIFFCKQNRRLHFLLLSASGCCACSFMEQFPHQQNLISFILHHPHPLSEGHHETGSWALRTPMTSLAPGRIGPSPFTTVAPTELFFYPVRLHMSGC